MKSEQQQNNEILVQEVDSFANESKEEKVNQATIFSKKKTLVSRKESVEIIDQTIKQVPEIQISNEDTKQQDHQIVQQQELKPIINEEEKEESKTQINAILQSLDKVMSGQLHQQSSSIEQQQKKDQSIQANIETSQKASALVSRVPSNTEITKPVNEKIEYQNIQENESQSQLQNQKQFFIVQLIKATINGNVIQQEANNIQQKVAQYSLRYSYQLIPNQLDPYFILKYSNQIRKSSLSLTSQKSEDYANNIYTWNDSFTFRKENEADQLNLSLFVEDSQWNSCYLAENLVKNLQKIAQSGKSQKNIALFKDKEKTVVIGTVCLRVQVVNDFVEETKWQEEINLQKKSQLVFREQEIQLQEKQKQMEISQQFLISLQNSQRQKMQQDKEKLKEKENNLQKEPQQLQQFPQQQEQYIQEKPKQNDRNKNYLQYFYDMQKSKNTSNPQVQQQSLAKNMKLKEKKFMRNNSAKESSHHKHSIVNSDKNIFNQISNSQLVYSKKQYFPVEHIEEQDNNQQEKIQQQIKEQTNQFTDLKKLLMQSHHQQMIIQNQLNCNFLKTSTEILSLKTQLRSLTVRLVNEKNQNFGKRKASEQIIQPPKLSENRSNSSSVFINNNSSIHKKHRFLDSESPGNFKLYSDRINPQHSNKQIAFPVQQNTSLGQNNLVLRKSQMQQVGQFGQKGLVRSQSAQHFLRSRNTFYK